MRRNALLAAAVLLVFGASAFAAPVFVDGPDPAFPFGGTLIDFEGLVEGAPVPALGGVVFSQPDGGTPIADNSPFLFAYDSSSGVGVLTGGPPSVVTTAGIIATFSSGQGNVGAFMSDTAPLGDYTITAFGAGGVFLESFVVPLGEFPSIPGFPGLDERCDDIPPFEATPARCGVFVGFSRAANDIFSIQFGPSSATPGSDAFAIDDLIFGEQRVPAPAVHLLLAFGLAAVGVSRRMRRG